MSEKKKRGRPSKNDSNSSYAIIRDPLMEPYFIQKDRYNYTVMERVTPTVGFAGKEAKGKELERPIAYLSSFRGALWRISKLKFTSLGWSEIMILFLSLTILLIAFQST